MRVDEASRLIAATPATIFGALSDRASLEAWLPPDGMRGELIEFDFRQDGRYRMRLHYTTPTHTTGKTSDDFDDVEVRFARLVPERLVEQLVTFDSPKPELAGVMRMSWILEPAKTGTRVTVRCVDVPAGVDPEDHAVGLASSLANLARFTER